MHATGGPGEIDAWLQNLHRRWVVVDNPGLSSADVEVRFRSTTDYSDLSIGIEPARWASVLYGDEVGDAWLQVGDGYLPLAIDGRQLLRKDRDKRT